MNLAFTWRAALLRTRTSGVRARDVNRHMFKRAAVSWVAPLDDLSCSQHYSVYEGPVSSSPNGQCLENTEYPCDSIPGHDWAWAAPRGAISRSGAGDGEALPHRVPVVAWPLRPHVFTALRRELPRAPALLPAGGSGPPGDVPGRRCPDALVLPFMSSSSDRRLWRK